MKDILPELNHKQYIENLNKYYDIRFCKKEEREQLINFIKEYWKPNHIFVLNPKLLDWQHFDKENNRYNYVVAKHKISGEFHSVLGFVPTTQFDFTIKHLEVWPCIWKSRDDIHVKGLGVALYYYMKSILDIETISILGISEIALSIYKYWNFQTGNIKHFYILNHDYSEYKLISNYEKVQNDTNTEYSNEKTLHECSLDDYILLPDTAFKKLNRYKSKDYYINRFYKHPFYNYHMYEIRNNDIPEGVIVTRECNALGHKCIRIVDMTCEAEILIGLQNSFKELLKENEYEYLDFVVAGINKSILLKAGFEEKSDSDIVISNYFEPFQLENINLDYAFKTVNDNAEKIFFKADADQDRPNVMI